MSRAIMRAPAQLVLRIAADSSILSNFSIFCRPQKFRLLVSELGSRMWTRGHVIIVAIVYTVYCTPVKRHCPVWRTRQYHSVILASVQLPAPTLLPYCALTDFDTASASQRTWGTTRFWRYTERARGGRVGFSQRSQAWLPPCPLRWIRLFRLRMLEDVKSSFRNLLWA